MKLLLKMTCCSVFFVLISSCGFKIDKMKLMLNPAGAIYYADVDKAIFKPNCVSCHNSANASGGVTLESYVEVNSNLSQISNAVAGGTMPPSAPLSTLEQQYLAAWIRNGAPEVESSDGSTPTPTPVATATPSGTPTNANVSYAMISSQVLENKCITCHNTNGSESRLPFDNYSNLMNTGEVSAGSPSSSNFYTAMSRGSMPPRSSGIPAVTSAELKLISDWITEGALEQ